MDCKTAYSKAAALCAQQERCCSEIRDKLDTWQVDPTEGETIIHKLVEEKFIDERRFAGFYARDKFRFNKWGRIKIAWHLRQKKIENSVISDVLSNFDEADYIQTLLSLLKDKDRALSGRDFLKKKAALVRYAVSKGFEYDQIMKTLDRLL